MRAALIAQFDGEPQIQARNAIALPLRRSRFGLNCSSKPMPFDCRLSVETPMTLAASLGLGLEMGFDPAILIREGVLLASLVALFAGWPRGFGCAHEKPSGLLELWIQRRSPVPVT